MATYTYQKADGSMGTTSTPTSAGSPGIASNSGWQVVNSGSLTPTPTPVIPPYQAPVPQSLESIASQNLTPSTSEPVTGSTSDLLSQIKAITDKQGTRSAVQGNLEDQAGLPALQKQLNEINAQIGSYTAQAKQFQVNQEDRQAPMFAITGAQAAAERQLNAKTFGLAAAAQALQGNIALAKDNVQRALAAEFDPLESKLKYQETLLNVNRDNLNKQDAAKAKAADQKLQADKEALAAQKDEKANIYKLVLDAGQNRASNQVLQAIQSAPDFATALRIASQAGVLAAPVKASASDISNAETSSVASRLTAAKGSDGYTDPNLYLSLRQASKMSPTEFDNRFGYLVNPLSAGRVGLSNTNSSQGAITPAEYSSGVNYLLTNGGTADDLEKFKTDRAFQAWVLSQQ